MDFDALALQGKKVGFFGVGERRKFDALGGASSGIGSRVVLDAVFTQLAFDNWNRTPN